MPTGLSVYDLDNTLLKGTIGFHFFKYLFKRKVYSYRDLASAALLSFKYKLGMLNQASIHESIELRFLSGVSAQKLLLHFSNFIPTITEKMLNANVVRTLLDAKKSGHYIVIATSAPEMLLRPILKFLPVDAFLASEYIVNEASDTLEKKRSIDGEAKKKFTEDLAEKFNLPKHHLYAYSDSITDLPLLESVGNPIAVRPDRKLKKMALLFKWEVLQ